MRRGKIWEREFMAEEIPWAKALKGTVHSLIIVTVCVWERGREGEEGLHTCLEMRMERLGLQAQLGSTPIYWKLWETMESTPIRSLGSWKIGLNSPPGQMWCPKVGLDWCSNNRVWFVAAKYRAKKEWRHCRWQMSRTTENDSIININGELKKTQKNEIKLVKIQCF